MRAIKNFSEQRCNDFLKHVVLSVLHIKQQQLEDDLWQHNNLPPSASMSENYDYLDLDMSLLGDDMLHFEEFNPEENGVDSVDSWDSLGWSPSTFMLFSS